MKNILFVFTISISITCVVNAATIWHVKPTATGTGDGSSWANASDLGTALHPTNGAVAGDEIWVHQGTYNGPFAIKSGVRVYGGFSGNELIASDSDPIANETKILGSASVRCISMSDADSSTVLRGFHLLGGTANMFNSGMGGGAIYMKNSNALIVQCTISSNYSEIGGAVFIEGGLPKFINCTFYNNGGSGCMAGGAVFVKEGNATFHNCLFYRNVAFEGGGIAVGDISAIINCTFANNIFTRIQNNQEEKIANDLHDYLGNTVVSNSIMWTTEITDQNNYIVDPRGSITVRNSNIKGGWPGTGNLDADPLFIDPANDKYRFSRFSPCKNSGDNLSLPQDVADLDWDGVTTETIPYELAPLQRIYNTTVDMGAFEFNCSTVESPLADPNLPDTGFGTSNRYITFSPTNPGRVSALRVTFTSMPSPFASFEGTTKWVDTPQEVSEGPSTSDPNSAAPGQGTFMLARLTCDPVYMDWSTVGEVIAVYGDEIVPDATYSIQAIYKSCGTLNSANYSTALPVATSTKWADVTGDCSVTPCTPPDGIVDIVDSNAVVDKWLGVAIPKARTDLNPDLPDLLVNIADVLKVSDGINGLPYPFDGPTSCSSGPGGRGGGAGGN